jgi:hypothetical protein
LKLVVEESSWTEMPDNKKKKVTEMVPVFAMWADSHGINDAIKRFRVVMAEYQVLECVEKYTETTDQDKK